MSEPETSVLVTVDGEPYGTICYAPVQADGYMDHLEGIRNGLAMVVGTEVTIDKLEDDGKAAIGCIWTSAAAKARNLRSVTP